MIVYILGAFSDVFSPVLGSFVGYPSGETNFLLLISSPQRITVTTCSQTTDFDT
jgi:hypothetical protein